MSTLKIPTVPVESTRNQLVSMVAALFETTFGIKPRCIASAPGRVNLIGEHTDYNGGYVLPAAIDRSVAVAAAPRVDRMLHIHSHNKQAMVQVSLDDLHPLKHDIWANYTAGIAYFLSQAGLPLSGASLCIAGDVPQAVGLSSSAALGVANAHALHTLFGGNLAPVDLIRLCQQSENDFVGVSCGIMDQFISSLGKASNALFLDCTSLDYEYIPLPANVRLLVCNTGVKRELTTSEYNKRRQECFYAVRRMSGRYPGIRSLRDVSAEQFFEAQDCLDPVLQKRARHVILENDRVLRSVRALKDKDLSEFGKLMYQSHLSLKLDFEVSCPELDAVVDICAEAEGVYGARMTGAGFGGSAVCLVEEESVQDVKSRLEREYPQKTGRTPSIHVCSIEDGALVLTA